MSIKRRANHRNLRAPSVNAGPGIPGPRPAPLHRLNHNELVGVSAMLRWCWEHNFIRRRR
jgi:hypothetical protein